MKFNTEVLACRWIEEEGQWLVKLRQHVPGENPRDFWDCCDLLVNASGILSSPKVRVENPSLCARVNPLPMLMTTGLVAARYPRPARQIPGTRDTHCPMALEIHPRAMGRGTCGCHRLRGILGTDGARNAAPRQAPRRLRALGNLVRYPGR